MAYSDALTAEEKDVLQSWLNLLRLNLAEQARTNNHHEAMNNGYLAANITTILGKLLAGDEIPNVGGLNGAAALTKASIGTLVGHCQGILTNYNTAAHRQLWADACGSVNMIG